MGNEAGTKAVCYECYTLAGRRGVQLLFENGEYCGFSDNEVELFFVQNMLEFESSVADYQFENVIKLSNDIRAGKFKEVWNG